MSDEEKVSADPSVEEQILAVAQPRLEQAADDLKDAFLAKFGDFIEEAHKDRLESLFTRAAEYKLKALAEKNEDRRRQWAQAAETSVRSIETLGLAAEIKADAKAASMIKEAAMLAIDTLGDIAWAVLETVGGALVSGVIKGVAGPAGAALLEEGASALADTFLGGDEKPDA